MSDFTNLTTNDIWFRAFFAALAGTAPNVNFDSKTTVAFAAEIADEAVKVVLERDEKGEDEDEDEDEDEPPFLEQMENKMRAIHGHPPLPAGPPRRTPEEVAEEFTANILFRPAIADLIARDRKGEA